MFNAVSVQCLTGYVSHDGCVSPKMHQQIRVQAFYSQILHVQQYLEHVPSGGGFKLIQLSVKSCFSKARRSNADRELQFGCHATKDCRKKAPSHASFKKLVWMTRGLRRWHPIFRCDHQCWSSSHAMLQHFEYWAHNDYPCCVAPSIPDSPA